MVHLYIKVISVIKGHLYSLSWFYNTQVIPLFFVVTELTSSERVTLQSSVIFIVGLTLCSLHAVWIYSNTIAMTTWSVFYINIHNNNYYYLIGKVASANVSAATGAIYYYCNKHKIVHKARYR